MIRTNFTFYHKDFLFMYQNSLFMIITSELVHWMKHIQVEYSNGGYTFFIISLLIYSLDHNYWSKLKANISQHVAYRNSLQRSIYMYS